MVAGIIIGTAVISFAIVMLVAVTGALMLSLGACTPAQTASYNPSNDSDNFRVMRRVVFVNGITDKYLLSIKGLCSITKDKEDAQLEVTCKTGDGDWLVLV